jgi:hypothetical protein
LEKAIGQAMSESIAPDRGSLGLLIVFQPVLAFEHSGDCSLR